MDCFLSMKLFEYQMDDNKSIMSQVEDLLVLVSRMKDLKVEVFKSLQVAASIAKLPTTWNDYRKKLLYTLEDLTLNQLVKHVRIEEETCILKKKFTTNIGLKVNVIETKTNKKRKHVDITNKNSSNKKNKTCFFCEKKGHFKKKCRFFKCLKGENDRSGKDSKQKQVNLIENSTEIIVVVSILKISMITEGNMTTF
jgi:hypothetical protein